jgi:hypothetical protein
MERCMGMVNIIGRITSTGIKDSIITIFEMEREYIIITNPFIRKGSGKAACLYPNRPNDLTANAFIDNT